MYCQGLWNIACFVVNLVFIFTPSHFDIDALVAQYQTLITPASYAFTIIWSIIFVAETVFCVVQFRHENLVRQTVGYDFAAANVMQALWVIAFLWLASVGLSTICLVGIIL
jgi:tryptophan-rich sensory protein